MSAVLVTGAGMVGAEIARQLSERGLRPVLLDLAFNRDYLDTILPRDAYDTVEGTILDRALVDRALREHDVSRVVHTAAVLPMRVGHAAHPGFFEVNTWGTANLLFAACDRGIDRFVMFSTNGVYQFREHGVHGPVEESYPVGLTPRNAYGNSKATAEFLLRELVDDGRLDAKIIRPGEIYGPVMHRGPHKIYWKEMIDAAVGGYPYVVTGEPEHRLDWVFAKDVARLACELALHPGTPDVAYNASYGRCVGIYDLLDTLDRLVPGHRVEIGDCGRGGWNHPLSTARAKRDLGFSPEYALDDGVRAYIEWYRRSGGGAA